MAERLRTALAILRPKARLKTLPTAIPSGPPSVGRGWRIALSQVVHVTPAAAITYLCTPVCSGEATE